MTPPKPKPRDRKVSLWRYARLFRQDILSAQPEHLYTARMAEFRTPFFRSYMVNEPALVAQVLKDEPDDFPKSARIREGLAPLLGNSVFVTNGETWKRQRRIIDPAFEGGRLQDAYPAMEAAGAAAVARLAQDCGDAPVEIEAQCSHLAADVIFRTLFSIPIQNETAAKVFAAFRDYQRAAPLLNMAALVPLPKWMPRPHHRRTRRAAGTIRRLIGELTVERLALIRQGRAPDDLATKIMTTPDPETGTTFSVDEMVDQVAIFFLAGHETSAAALGWALYLLATHPDWQDRVAHEAGAQLTKGGARAGSAPRLPLARDVFRETLRLYPPVPMMVRENSCPKRMRAREISPGSQIVVSPWHLHRNGNLWADPDSFAPDRWSTENGRACMRSALIPFSAGPRVCPGAGFAMLEGPLLLSMLVRDYRFQSLADRVPVPVAHLTVRAKDGIWLRVRPRDKT